MLRLIDERAAQLKKRDEEKTTARSQKNQTAPRAHKKKKRNAKATNIDGECEVGGSVDDDVPQDTKCRKLILHPTAEQRRTLKLWIDGARFAYNLAAEFVNATGRRDKKSLRAGADVSTGRVRAKTANGEKVPDRQNGWERQAPERLWSVPAKLRDAAIVDVHKACATLVAKEGSLRRKLKFRRSKDRAQSIYVESQCLNCKKKTAAFAATFGTTSDRSTMRTESGKRLPLVFDSDVRVVYERFIDRFSICIPSKIVRAAPQQCGDATGPETQGPECISGLRRVASIDPGIRTFATIYDLQRERIVEWGMQGGRKNGTSRGTELLGWLTRKIGKLDRKAKRRHGRNKKRILAVANRIRQRIKDLTAELHHKLALWLCRNYDVVLLPRFSAKDFSEKKRRRLSRNNVRKLANMAPFSFRQFLLHKAREYGTEIIICTEQYTSVTCTECGRWNRELGTDKWFVCPACGASYDRDAGGARNILLLFVS